MSEVVTVGLDLAKPAFQAFGAGASGRAVLRRTLRRDRVPSCFRQWSRCVVAMEVRGGAHFRGCGIGKPEHEVRLIPPACVTKATCPAPMCTAIRADTVVTC